MARRQIHLEEFPELATTDFWRTAVRNARKAMGLTQRDLARAIGVSQPIVSNLESGAVSSSRAVVPIADHLRIPLPQVLFEDELEQRWMEAGRLLRRRDARVFEAQVEAMERLAVALSRG